ncbi:MAG: peptidylprolyl isomerase [Planctomycetaceae bacterium]|nr:peptidylprolyl isomerase [Planctomycetaceae bacterium]
MFGPRLLLSLSLFLAIGCLRQVEQSEAPPISNAESAEDDLTGRYRVKLETSKGDVVIEVTPSWAPEGAARFRELVEAGFYDECRFFRVLPGFMAQIGMSGDPAVMAKWSSATIDDDPVRKSNQRAFVTFAKTGAPNSRSTQFFVNYGDNARLDPDGFAPFGKVVEGMDVVDLIESRYGEQPNQDAIKAQGNQYLNEQFPELDFIKKATIIE